MYRPRVRNPRDPGARPRLSSTVYPRRYVDERERVALHAGTELLLLEEGAWRIASALDGTRDIEGIRLAAEASGVLCTREEVTSLVDHLVELGMVEWGLPPPTQEPAEVELVDRPVFALPSYAFHCDGRGGCCSHYPSIVLDVEDANRARAGRMRLLPNDPAAERSLMPFDGSLSRRRLTMALREGSCLQLEEDGRCALHREGGYDAKPKGCQRYPRTFVDDGQSVHVSIAVECDCVLRSLDHEPTEPLTTVARSRDLPSGIVPRRLPDLVPIAGQGGVRRDAAVRWIDAFGRETAGADVVRALVDGARWLCREVGEAAGDPPRLDAAIEAYVGAIRGADESARAWRAPADRLRAMRAAACAAVERVDPSTAVVDARAEAFFLRAATFGREFLGPRPVAHALVAAAARLLIARHMEHGPLGHPIAVVEAVARSFSPPGP